MEVVGPWRASRKRPEWPPRILWRPILLLRNSAVDPSSNPSAGLRAPLTPVPLTGSSVVLATNEAILCCDLPRIA